MSQKISEQTKVEALKIAKGIQKPNQTKEQTKLISQGIEKGITLYKQQQKAKAREADKQRKIALKEKKNSDHQTDECHKETHKSIKLLAYLPWVLLIISWTAFLGFKWLK